MTAEEKQFNLYLTVLRFVQFKITRNIERIYLDFDLKSERMLLTAFFNLPPSELELELFDDIVTNSNAHIPDFFVDYKIISASELHEGENRKHDFIIFAFYYD